MNIRIVMILVLVLAVSGVCFCADGKADGKVDLKLASYNIRYAGGDRGANSWDNRKGPLAEYINELKPDVIGMQEALLVQVKFMKANLDGYAMVGVGRDDGKCDGEFSPVFYNREKFVLDSCGTFWLSETPETPGIKGWGANCVRICSWVRLIEIKSSKAFYVYNTHFDHVSQPAKDNSAKLIAERVNNRTDKDPVFLMGDFNSTPESFPVKYLTGKVENAVPPVVFTETMSVLNTNLSLKGTSNSFGRRDNPPRIDYIFYNGNVKVKDGAVGPSEVDGQFLSDHNPIWVVMGL